MVRATTYAGENQNEHMKLGHTRGVVLTAISGIIAHDAHACDGSKRCERAVKEEVVRIGRQLCATHEQL
jgi:hypothetical protein